jgi:outer membrane biosynthesis protein TonB
LTGKPGITGLVGYTLDYWAKPVPNSKWSGRVNVKVTVNPRGQVVKATATGASGDLASHPEVRRACEQAALKSRFSVPKNTMTEAFGTITYIWH